jgi:hypothetical protein
MVKIRKGKKWPMFKTKCRSALKMLTQPLIILIILIMLMVGKTSKII